MNFKLDPGVQALLPPLTKEEFDQLELLITTDGHVDPGVVAVVQGERILADGYNRQTICKKHKIHFPTREIKIPSRELLYKWVRENQCGRRNLTPEQRAYFMGKEYLEAKKPHGDSERLSPCSQNENMEETAEKPQERTVEAVAEKNGVSPATVHRNADFAAAVDRIAGEKGEEEKRKILTGESGKTKAEVIEEGKPPPMCSRCRRVGPVRDCQACQELREKKPKVKETRPAPTHQPRQKPQKNGEPVFDWKAFGNSLRDIVQQPDRLYRAFGVLTDKGAVKRDKPYEAMSKAMNEFVEAFKGRYEELSKKKAPKGF